MTPKLPPPPEPYDKATEQMTTNGIDWVKKFDLFTTEQMQTYAAEAVRAALAEQAMPPQVPNEYSHLLTPGALWDMYAEYSEQLNTGNDRTTGPIVRRVIHVRTILHV